MNYKKDSWMIEIEWDDEYVFSFYFKNKHQAYEAFELNIKDNEDFIKYYYHYQPPKRINLYYGRRKLKKEYINNE